MKQGYVYILANKNNTTLYVGVTSDLAQRFEQHKSKTPKSFTKKYNLEKLVYYEAFDDIKSAIMREKQLKAGSRKKKEELINQLNPGWEDLSGLTIL